MVAAAAQAESAFMSFLIRLQGQGLPLSPQKNWADASTTVL